jgi:hypothetical protein
MSEKTFQEDTKYRLSQEGYTLFRNNVGLAKLADGRRIRYGLCPGSSDLIGWKTITVTPEMIGQKIAVFTAIEVKSKHGKTSGKQQNFIDAVRQAGGIAEIRKECEDE